MKYCLDTKAPFELSHLPCYLTKVCRYTSNALASVQQKNPIHFTLRIIRKKSMIALAFREAKRLAISLGFASVRDSPFHYLILWKR